MIDTSYIDMPRIVKAQTQAAQAAQLQSMQARTTGFEETRMTLFINSKN
jgi:hypothetical protein